MSLTQKYRNRFHYLAINERNVSNISFLQKTNFQSYARIPPIDLLKLEPDIYRLIVAVTELVCVGLILLMDYRIKILATYVFLLIMVGAIYTHVMVGDGFDKMGGAIFGLVLVLVRLYTMGELRSVQIKID